MRAKLIRRWKPWEQSTGPRTEDGKAKVSQNATQHGMRTRKAIEELRDLREFLREAKEHT